MKKLLPVLLLLVTACAPSAKAVETAIAQTAAAVPTSTSLPTRTPRPAATATQRPSPTPSIDPAYIAAVQEAFIAWQAAYEKVSDLMQLVTEPGVYASTSWKVSMLNALQEFQTAGHGLEALPEPPANMRTFGVLIDNVATDTSRLVLDTTLFVTDVSYASAATLDLQRLLGNITALTAELDQLQ